MITWTLSLDGLITSGVLLSVLCALLRMLWRMAGRFTRIDDTLEQLRKETGQIAGALREIAMQKVEIEHIKEDIRELKHGEGYVLPIKGAHEHPVARG